MSERYFVNRVTRQARIGHGKAWARQQVDCGFEEVPREQFEAFRARNMQGFAQQVAS